MDTAAEIAALRQEVATLKQEMADLQKFFTIRESDAPTREKVLRIRCSEITLCNADAPAQSQGSVWADADGPGIALHGTNEQPRLLLRVKNDFPHFTTFGADFKPAVEIGADEDKRGFVSISDEGNPRVALKVRPEGGVVTVVHDDGLPRAFLSSAQGKGELVIVNADMKVAVKASSEGYDGGGLLMVHHANGRPGIMLVTNSATPAVLLKDSQGRFTATLPHTGLAGEK